MAGEKTGETGTQVYANWVDTDTPVQTPQGDYQGTTTMTWTSPHFEGEAKASVDSHGIHPRLYFRYVKSKLNMIELRFFKHRMKQLKKLAEEYIKTGQIAMSEACMQELLVITKESVAMACGFKTFITAEHAEKFRYKIRNNALKITPLKNFARPMPPDIVKKVKLCMKKKLFDDYVIFHLDNRSVRETEKDKKERRERDPIIFGTINHANKYYFIGDWEDEFDDLRLKDIIKKLSLKRGEITLKQKIELFLKKTKKSGRKS